MNIVKDMKVTRGLAPVAAGTSNQNGAVVDMLTLFQMRLRLFWKMLIGLHRIGVSVRCF